MFYQTFENFSGILYSTCKWLKSKRILSNKNGYNIEKMSLYCWFVLFIPAWKQSFQNVCCKFWYIINVLCCLKKKFLNLNTEHLRKRRPYSQPEFKIIYDKKAQKWTEYGQCATNGRQFLHIKIKIWSGFICQNKMEWWRYCS